MGQPPGDPVTTGISMGIDVLQQVLKDMDPTDPRASRLAGAIHELGIVVAGKPLAPERRMSRMPAELEGGLEDQGPPINPTGGGQAPPM